MPVTKRTVLTITESELRKLLKLPAKCSVRGVNWNLLRDRLEISVIGSGLESRYAAHEGDVCVVTRIQAHDDRSESE